MSNQKVVIVTGGGKGIGAAICRALTFQNAQVVIAEKDLKLKKLVPKDPNVLFVQTDVKSEISVKKLMKETLRHFGRIDALVNNAGILPDENSSFEDNTLSNWHEYIETNLTGPFLCSKYAAPHLRKQKGSIVNIASTRALQSQKNDLGYSASKGGLVSLTHALAISLGPQIRVNSISPGWIHTGKESLKKSDHKQHPAGRVGKPEDIANMVLYLISSQAEFITGQNFIIDGGMTIKIIYQ